jgi:hypothetical protein
MVVASVAGLLAGDLYRDGAWAREAARGGDLVTLVLAAPLLVVSLLLTWRGSRRAEPVWIGMLVYGTYAYAYYVFGSAFNDLFLVHIGVFSASVFGLVCALTSADIGALWHGLRGARSARWVGAFLVLVGIAQGGLWIFVVARNAVTGEVLHDIPVRGQHLVFALDLSLLVPALVVAGALLFRRRPLGFVLGAAMAVFGAAYQANLMVASAFQDAADVRGVAAFAPESVFLTAAFAVAALLMLIPRRRLTR